MPSAFDITLQSFPRAARVGLTIKTRDSGKGQSTEFLTDPNGTKIRRIWDDFLPRRGYEDSAQGFNPISANLMRSPSMGEWLLSRRDRLIVARHEVPG